MFANLDNIKKNVYRNKTRGCILYFIYRFSSDYYRDDWSPGSATSISSSPPSTPPLPFYDVMENDENDENTEDNYSPVCSDTEIMENEDGK